MEDSCCGTSVGCLLAQNPAPDSLRWAQSLLDLPGGGHGMMGILLALLVAACMFFMGTLLWVICISVFTIDIPEAISHPMKLRVIHCIFELCMTWVSFAFYLSPHCEGRGEHWGGVPEASS